MAVTVKKAFVRGPTSWLYRKDGWFRLLIDSTLALEIVKDEKRFVFDARFLKGYETDGLSVPKIFQKWFPKFDKVNILYNFSGMFHDWLYSVKGNTGDAVFSRSECDDLFRGILREAGISRTKAGIMDWCVGLFAGGSRHWGNDSRNCRELVKCSKMLEIDGV